VIYRVKGNTTPKCMKKICFQKKPQNAVIIHSAFAKEKETRTTKNTTFKNNL